MGSIGLNVVQQSMINITHKINPSHNPLPQSNPFRGLKFTQSKLNKVGNFRIVKASSTETEGTNMSTTIDKLGVRIEKNPPQTRLSQLGVLQWPKWDCPPSKFPWTYEAKETCYLLQGKVKVYPDGSSEPVEFGARDLVVFPKGMKCTWDVSEAVDKHYKFEVIDDEHLEAKQLPIYQALTS